MEKELRLSKGKVFEQLAVDTGMGQKAKSDEKKGGMWKSFKKTFFIFGFRF
jgi:hypothetical protein